MVNDLNASHVTIDKLKADCMMRENTLNRHEADIAEIQRELHIERDRHREAMEHMAAEHRNERAAWERMKHNHEQRIKELENVLIQMEHELATIKTNYERLCHSL